MCEFFVNISLEQLILGVHFGLLVQMSEGVNFSVKKIFEEISLEPAEMDVHFTTLCPNKWRDKKFF